VIKERLNMKTSKVANFENYGRTRILPIFKTVVGDVMKNNNISAKRSFAKIFLCSRRFSLLYYLSFYIIHYNWRKPPAIFR